MDDFSNSTIEKHKIYEIYRACRLCGAGAGYKMPIIQNVVDLDGAEVELKQKIRDCVQIEVHQDDKMPPLICELCVDKVNDFYEFLEMCRQTNKRTRLRLGLPPQTLPRGAPDAGDCILGVTEPIFVNDDSNEPLSNSKGKQKGKDGKNKAGPVHKKEVQKIKIEPRSLRSKAPSPPRLRGTKRHHDEDLSLSTLQPRTKKPTQPMPKSILKRERDYWSEDNSSDYSNPKQLRSKDSNKIEMKTKRVKIVVKPTAKYTKSSSTAQNPTPVSHRSRSQPNMHKCKVCKATFNNMRSISNHMRSHNRSQQTPPPPKKEPRPIECKLCSRQFPNKHLQGIHQCTGRPSKSSRSSRQAPATKNVVKPVMKPKHVSSSRRASSSRKRGEAAVDPKLLQQVRPFQVRVARCDSLLVKTVRDHYDVAHVDYDFGLDKKSYYPYISSFKNFRIKSEPGYMVNIQDEIKEVFDWDSENETDSDLGFSDTIKVKSLLSLSLKSIYSAKVFGKMPKKRRKLNVDKAFDSIINTTNFNSERPRDIADIIDSLSDEKENEINKTLDDSKDDSDSLFGDGKTTMVSNNDFDSLFNSKENNVKNDNSVKTVDVEETCNNSINLDRNQNDDSNETNISSENILECNGDIVQSKVDEKIVNEKDYKINASHLIQKYYKKDSNESTLDDNELEVESSIVPETNAIDDIASVSATVSTCSEIDTQRSDSIIENKVKIATEDFEEETEHINEKTQESDSLKRENDSDSHKVSFSINNTSETSQELNNVGGNTIHGKECNKEIENNVKSNAASIDEGIAGSEDNSLIEKVETSNNTTENKETHVNGQTEEIALNMDDLEDVSDSEMEENRLLKALDDQIGESETTDTKVEACEKDKTFTDDICPASTKSMDLESISDDEFSLND